MCRSKELGGRRCPAYSDPAKVALYNGRRRERYALKTGNQSAAVQQKSGGLLLDFSDIQSAFKLDSPRQEQYFVDAKAFLDKLNTKTTATKIINGFQEYTTLGYHTVRDYLSNDGVTRDGRKLNISEIKYAQNIITQIDKGLKLAESPAVPRTLYRGMRIPEHVEDVNTGSWVEENFPVNGVVSQRNYMSTTHNPVLAINVFSADMDDKRESVLFEIVSKNGATLGQGTSSWGDKEYEVLIPRDAKFKVVSVERNKELSVDALYPEIKSRRTIIQLTDAE